jgi:hypothetical protein
VTQLRDSLASVHAFLDDDEQGRQAAHLAEEEGLLATADITMTLYPGAKHDAEFEDYVVPDRYREAILHEFGVKIEHSWISKLSKGKWAKRMPAIFQASGTPWTKEIEKRAKAVVAREVATKPAEALNPAGQVVLAALVQSLEMKLNQRNA